MQEIKQQLYDYAIGLGFEDFKAAKAEPLELEFENYQIWLKSGFNADMRWMEKNLEKRKDISQIQSEAKTVIVTSHSYYTVEQPEIQKEFINRLGGKVSRYKWGGDYHKIILKKLNMIVDRINEIAPDSESKAYVDTRPILEKQWAVRSGIGWQGKNGLLISRNTGTWIFLGLIITTLELEPDSPTTDFCGKCTRCMDACPTKAIIKPKVVDSNKCISYWTIESKTKEFPKEIAENLNGWHFGCDICQDVCPWNKYAKITLDPEFQPQTDKVVKR